MNDGRSGCSNLVQVLFRCPDTVDQPYVLSQDAEVMEMADDGFPVKVRSCDFLDLCLKGVSDDD